MKKLFFIIICLVLLPIHASALTKELWKTSGGAYNPIFGNPIVVRDVQLVKEVIVNEQAYYMYKLIISRPSFDNGTGVAPGTTMDTRLYYWASLVGPNTYFSIYDDRETVQVPFQGRDDLIVVYLTQGLHPNRNRQYVRVGVLPYPMAYGYDFRRAIQLYRSDYKLYLDMVAAYTGLWGMAVQYVGEKVKDAAIDGTLSRMVSVYGQVVQIEAYAKAPNIVGLTINQANRELRIRTLIPRLNRKIYNPDKRLHGRVKAIVGKYDIKDNILIRANTQVSYDVWTSNPTGYVTPAPPIQPIRPGGKEICGDGIDNNGNNQIDEGCYAMEIIVDDNQCDDDTMKLIIDGRDYGNNPAGHKRHYNIAHLAPGQHKLTIYGVHSGGAAMGCGNQDEITYSVQIGTKGKVISGSVKTGGSKTYTFTK